MPRKRSRSSNNRRNNVNQVSNFFKRLASRSTPSKKHLSKFWTFITVVATIAGLITFFGRDMKEIFDMYVNSRQFRVAKPQETLVIIFDFSGEKGVDVSNRIYSYIEEKNILDKVNNVRVERYKGVAPVMVDDVNKIASEYNAAFAIWGLADSYGIKPKFTFLQHSDSISRFDLQEFYSDQKSYNFFVSQAIPQQFEYLIYFSAGQIAYASKDYTESIYLLTEALNIAKNSNFEFDNSTKSLSFIKRANAYYAMGDYSAAIEDYTASLGSDMDGEAYCKRGLARWNSIKTTGDIGEVMNDGNLAKDTAPDNDCGFYLIGTALIELNMYEQSITQFSYAIKVSPEHEENYYIRGYAYSQLGDYENALNDLKTAISLDPNWAPAHCFRGEIYEKMGNKESAISDYTECLRIEPNYQRFPGDTSNYYQERLKELTK